MPDERDERWVYVALAILAVAYVVYRYRGSVDLPDLSFHGLRKVAGTLPYLVATFFGVFFQIWGRRKQAADRKRMEEELLREGSVRQAQGVMVQLGRRRMQSFEADLHLTRAALYVFDTAGKRAPMRVQIRRSTHGAFVEDASIEAGAGDGPPVVIVAMGGPARQSLGFSTSDAKGWWVDIRGALGKSTDVTAAAEPGLPD